MKDIINLVCIPYAGAGISIFKKWKLFLSRINVIPIQLPGREKTYHEELLNDLPEAVNFLYFELYNKVDKVLPTVIFGHSFGAILAYELTKKLIENNFNIRLLVVSGSPAPFKLRKKRATGLNDLDFINCVQEFANFKDEKMSNPEILDIVLPILRADVKIHEDYKYHVSKKLSIPVYSLRGKFDTLLTKRDAKEWSLMTESVFEYFEFAGNHMYLNDKYEEILNLINEFSRECS